MAAAVGGHDEGVRVGIAVEVVGPVQEEGFGERFGPPGAVGDDGHCDGATGGGTSGGGVDEVVGGAGVGAPRRRRRLEVATAP